MAKTDLSNNDSFWQSFYIALFIFLVSIIIGHITTSFKEKFTEKKIVSTVGNIIHNDNS